MRYAALVGLFLSASFAFGAGATSQPAKQPPAKADAKADAKAEGAKVAKPLPKLSELSGRFIGFKLLDKRLEGGKLILTIAEGNKSVKGIKGFKGKLFVVEVEGGKTSRHEVVDGDSEKVLNVGEVAAIEIKLDLPDDDEQDKVNAKWLVAAIRAIEVELAEVTFEDGTTRDLKEK